MQSEIWQVGEFLVSRSTNTIQREGSQPRKLPPRLINALLYFASHRGEVITRQELVDNLWDRSVVTDQTVTQTIFELRKYLRDGRGHHEAVEYIRTIPKRGYQCLVEVRTPEALAAAAGAPAEAQPQKSEADLSAEALPAAAPAEPKAEAPAQAAQAAPAAPEPEPLRRKTLHDFFLSFWLNEDSAGFKRAAY